MTNTRKTHSRLGHWFMAAGCVVAVVIATSIFIHAIAVARIIGHGSLLWVLLPIGMLSFLLVDRRD